MTSPAPVGLLVVDKPAGLTSHGVVARARRALGTRKVGHAGTLDPMATGVLLLGVGRATRLLGHLALSDKTYDATIRLGYATTTDDAEGERLPSPEGGPEAHARTATSAEEIREALAAMVGEVDQVPSAVSAVKVDGKRAYARVRAGEQVELAPRRVRIDEITVHDVRRVDDADCLDCDCVDVDVTVACSSGTYVRAIARDLGETLGTGGHLTALRRTSIGAGDRAVTLADACTLDRLDDAASADEVPLMTTGQAARRFFDCVEVDHDQAVAVGHGKRLRLGRPPEAPLVAVLGPAGDLLALHRGGEPREDGDSLPVVVFV